MDDIQKENIRRLRDFATKVLVDAAAADLQLKSSITPRSMAPSMTSSRRSPS